MPVNNTLKVKKRIDEIDIFHIIRHHHLLSRLLLLSPYKILGQIGSRIFVPEKDFCAFYLSKCALIIFIQIYSFYLFSKFGIFLRIVQAIFNCLCICVMLIWPFVYKKQAVKILKHFEQSEKFFKENGIVYSHKKLSRLIIAEFFFILFATTYVFVTLTLEYIEKYHELCTYPLFLLPNTFIYCYLCQYYNYVFILEDWLSSLKKYVEKLYYEEEKYLDGKLFIVRNVYDAIYKMSQMVQIYYQIPILFIKIGSFINTTAFTYLWYVSKGAKSTTYFWILVNVLKLIVLSFVCERCTVKVFYLTKKYLKN